MRENIFLSENTQTAHYYIYLYFNDMLTVFIMLKTVCMREIFYKKC